MARPPAEQQATPPRVSLALATHDGGSFLASLLASIAAQTTPPAELVAYDDGSTDDSAEMLERFGATAPFEVRIIRGSTCVGSTRAFERALEQCTGDLIGLCDQDDIWRRDKIERIASAFERNPELGLVFSDATLIDDVGGRLGRSLWGTLGGRSPASDHDLDFFLDSLVRPTVPGCTAVFSARCREVALPFPPALGGSKQAMQHDAWLVAIAGATGGVRALPDALIAYRIHGGQQIGLRGSPTRSRLDRTAKRALSLTTGRSLLQRELERRAGGVQFVSDRLATVEGNAWTDACHDAAMDVAEHLQNRIGLPRTRRQRVPAVLREWRTGRYARYSSGALSAIADAISRT